jgi:Nitrogenase molybdenum-iron protein, alpha and beta chains
MDIENNLVFLIYEEDDIIHGASERIRTAILETFERSHPDVLFVVSTCLPEIVGEDIEAVARQARSALPVPVLFIKTENFTEITTRKGLENTMVSFMDLMGLPGETLKNTVNIIGSNASEFPGTELSRVLEELGFRINVVFPSQCDLMQIRNASKAQYNILINRHSTPLAEQMKIKYGIPYILFEQAYSPESILAKYRELGTFLGCDLAPVIQDDYKKLNTAIRTARETLCSKSVILSFNSGRIFDMGTLLALAGMSLPVIAANEFSDQDRADARHLCTLSQHTKVIRNLSWHPLDTCISHIRPDFFLAFGGPEAPYCAKFGVNHRYVIMRPHLNGFAAADRILNTLLAERPGYSLLILREKMRQKAEES